VRQAVRSSRQAQRMRPQACPTQPRAAAELFAPHMKIVHELGSLLSFERMKECLYMSFM